MATRTPNRARSVVDAYTGPVRQSARNVWLAGLGAASLTRKEASKVLDQLIAEGEKFELRSRQRLEQGKAQAKDTLSDVADRMKSSTARARKILERGAEPVAYHLLPKGEGWTVRKEGSQQDISLHATKEAALEAARGLAQAHEPSRLVVHRSDGTIQTSYSYGTEA